MDELFVSRLCAGGDPLRCLVPGRLTNRLLLGVAEAERALIARGISFPAGSSLLVVARRLA